MPPELVHLIDDLWFPTEQPTLLHLLNGETARDVRQLLRIDLNIPTSTPIVKISKNAVTARIGEFQWVSDFRIGAKWGNVIRTFWDEYKEYADYIEAKFWKEQRYREWQRGLVAVGGGQDTFFPNADPETDTVDGWARNQGDATWASIRGAATGSAISDDSGALFVRIACSGDVSGTDDWDDFVRAFILFNTGDTIDGNIVDAASQGFTLNSVTDNFTAAIRLVTSSPATDTAVVTADYDQLGTVAQATDLALSGLNTDDSTYNDFTLNSTGLGNISTSTGDPITRFGYVLDHDADDAEPTAVNNEISTCNNINTAETAGTGQDERLVVTHSGPPIGERRRPTLIS